MSALLTEMTSKTEELLDKIEDSNTLIHDICRLCREYAANLQAELDEITKQYETEEKAFYKHIKDIQE